MNYISSVKNKLLRILNFLDFNHVCNIIISNNEKSILRCRYTQKKKLRDLIPGYEVNPTRFSHDPNKVTFNFSSHAFTENEKSLLCKGIRFSIPLKKIEYADFLTQFELLYRDTVMCEMKSENRDFLKNKLKDVFSTLKSYSFDKVEKTLSEAESIALKNLIERKDLVIQKADKGNAVVITYRTKYLEGIKSLLSDSSKFMRLPIDEGKWLNYFINVESKLKDRFKVLKNEEKHSEKEFDNICPVGTTAGILYGNPKVHKTVVNNTPKFRPILSAINTPTYLLAKYLKPILSPLTTDKFTVKNSFDFAGEAVNYDHNLYMASLDVESLFTNIPLEETIKNCVNDLLSNNFYSGKLSRKDLYDLLKRGTTELSFIFDNKLYKQIDGAAMGSPLGLTLANAFLCLYEKIWLNECPSQFEPVVYRRYVENIFVLFKFKEHVKLFVNYMNSKHKNIKFTFESEDSNNFSFLDVKITRKDKQFVTSIFRKATFSGVYTNYDSFILETYKIV